ncbi:MAG: shikimate dehydrogenase [Candidatus Bathyarchaeia archaeon]
MEISGKTKLCGLIGDPVEHSLSPQMHNAAFKHLKLNFVYLAFRVEKDALEDAVRGIRGLQIHGLNVTMPYKTVIIKYLDEIDNTAMAVESVNTVLNIDGKLKGFNTDGMGALKALENNGVELNGKKVLLLGAGGAAKSIAFQMIQEAEEIKILNRNGEKAKELAYFLQNKFGRKSLGAALLPGLLKEWLKEADILINATSVGMHPNIDQTLVKREWLRPELTVMDIVYNPIETRLLREAKAAGAKVIYGTEMLVYQGAASFEIWFGRPAPVDIMKKAVLRSLKWRIFN